MNSTNEKATKRSQYISKLISGTQLTEQKLQLITIYHLLIEASSKYIMTLWKTRKRTHLSGKAAELKGHI